MTSWFKYNGHEGKNHYKNEFTLNDKRYKILTYFLLNDNNSEFLYVESIVTFYSPSNFTIEFLRIKMCGISYDKYITIIDGRRNMKDTIDETKSLRGENFEINNRVFPKYREPDRIDYNI